MKGTLLVCIFLIVMKICVAQDACPEFPRLMKEADQFVAKKDYRMALNKYNSAKTCSPKDRQKVDDKINKLFDKIQAETRAARVMEQRTDSMYKSLMAAIAREKQAEEDKMKSDTTAFRSQNQEWLSGLPEKVQGQLMIDIVLLRGKNQGSVADSLVASFKQLVLANDWIKDYDRCQRANQQTLDTIKLAKDSIYIPFFGLRLLEDYYNLAAFRLDNARALLPSWKRNYYNGQIEVVEKFLENVRIAATKGYYIPDTVIGLTPYHWLYARCANSQDFVIANLDYRDYNKIQVHYINYSLPSFTVTTDSFEVVTNRGKLNRFLASSPNFKNTVRTAVAYTLKKNNAQITDSFRIVPNSTALFDSTGKIISQFGEDAGTSHYFSPDGNLAVTWRPDSSLVLYNILTKKLVRLTDDNNVRAMNISTHSDTIAYYNPGTRTIYFSGTDGRLLFRIPLAQLGLKDLDDLDFAGNDDFLRIKAGESILLVHIPDRKILLSCSSQRIHDIVVSPSGKEILLNCNVTYNTTSKSSNSQTKNYENLVLIVDEHLHIKSKLLGDVQHLFFTPDGRYVIGYDDRSLVRWDVLNNTDEVVSDHSFLSIEELIDNSYFPYSRYASINNGYRIQRGAYHLVLDMAPSEKDTLVQSLYYHQSENLFNRLAFGDAQNILQQNIPFFHDWCNWIERRLGNRDYSTQFSRQQVGTELFDKMVNTGDSVYPQQLYYAANSHMIFGQLYDSLRKFNRTYLDLIREEIALRQRVLVKDPDNSDNIYYLKKAYLKFDTVCNIMGENFSKNKQYDDRLALFRMAEEYLSNRQRLFYDTFQVRKKAYDSALIQLAASFIYIYVSRPGGDKAALDSAFYYANMGLQITSDQNHAAYFLMVEAFAHSLNNEVEKAEDVCKMTRAKYPQISKETMLRDLEFLKSSGTGSMANIQRVEDYIRQAD